MLFLFRYLCTYIDISVSHHTTPSSPCSHSLSHIHPSVHTYENPINILSRSNRQSSVVKHNADTAKHNAHNPLHWLTYTHSETHIHSNPFSQSIHIPATNPLKNVPKLTQIHAPPAYHTVLERVRASYCSRVSRNPYIEAQKDEQPTLTHSYVLKRHGNVSKCGWSFSFYFDFWNRRERKRFEYAIRKSIF